MSKVVRIHGLGEPEVMQLDDIDVANPGPTEVRIAVSAIGLNRVETMYRSGGFGEPKLPAKIGYEAAGVIESLGKEVKEFSLGDRVATLPGLSMEDYGTYGELILYPADWLVRIPDEQSMTNAAASWMQYLTAYGLISHGDISAGDTVLITAASSSVGLAAIQICNALGAVPIAITRGRAKVDRLLQQGAAHVITSEEDDVPQKIMSITDGRGASILFDAVAGQALAQLLNCLAPQGIAILYGTLAGAEVHLALHSIMLNGLSIRGFAANELLENPQMRAAAIAFINHGIQNKTLQPVIDREFQLSEIVAAHHYLEGNTQLGKIVVGVTS